MYLGEQNSKCFHLKDLIFTVVPELNQWQWGPQQVQPLPTRHHFCQVFWWENQFTTVQVPSTGLQQALLPLHQEFPQSPLLLDITQDQGQGQRYCAQKTELEHPPPKVFWQVQAVPCLDLFILTTHHTMTTVYTWSQFTHQALGLHPLQVFYTMKLPMVQVKVLWWTILWVFHQHNLIHFILKEKCWQLMMP